MQFRILGALEVLAAGQPVELGGARQQRILAALLLRPNRVVTLSRLVEATWDGEPPATAEHQVRNRVAAIRSVLTRVGGLVDTRGDGYLIRVADGELDAQVFDDLVEQGRSAGEPALLRSALALWRGPALDGLGGDLLRREAAALEERRLAALEDCVDLELAAGRQDELTAELADLVAAHPLRERLVGQLMTALHRSGRSAEAAEVYAALARRLSDELGIDPSPGLRRRHDALAREHTDTVRPQQLPADIAGFTGRMSDLTRLDQLLSDGQIQSTVVISAIAGTAGVGKTALAVRWAHRVRDKFADGQLYANLRGFAPTPPVRPIDVLGGFLRAFGVPGDKVPADVDGASAMYRDLLADKRVLVLLDNAADAAQVRPLLPGNSASLALVTSRDVLAGLVARDGAKRVTLDVLHPDEAAALLVRALGRDRVAAEPAAAAELARLCAYLPLALRIAAANLDTSIGEYVEKLAAGNRLAALAVDGDAQAAVRAAFDLSYEALPPPVQRMFRLLGRVPGPDVTAAAAGALADLPEAEAGRLLDRLAAAHLLESQPGGRYAFHDLLRAYAADLPGEPGAEERLHDFYVYTARAAADVVNPGALRLDVPAREPPGFADHAAALGWLDAERVNLVQAARQTRSRAAWLIADALRLYLFNRMYVPDLLAVADAGLAAAEAAGELRPQAIAQLSLGNLRLRQSRYDDAIGHLTRTLDIARGADWPEAQSAALRYLGDAYRMVGRPRDAVGHLTAALALDRRLGWVLGEVHDLITLGMAHRDMGELAPAAAYLRDALTVSENEGLRGGVANALDNLGEVALDEGRVEEARAHLAVALDLFRAAGDQAGEVDAMRILATAHRAAGAPGEALALAEAALATATAAGWRRHEAKLHNVLAALHDDAGRPDAAIEHRTLALDLAGQGGNRYPEVDAMIGLAGAYRRLGRHDEARRWAGRAAEAAGAASYRLLAARARDLLTEA